jgi:DNA topoisomerase-1
MQVDFSGAPEAFLDSKVAAECAGLHYRSDEDAGISRRRHGKGFAYLAPDGRALKDTKHLARIAILAIPPAWSAVWISPDANSHLAATGRDARGRKQYRYNPEFIQIRDAAKYEHVIGFARLLPKLRRQIASHMALSGLPREKVLATIARLLKTTNSRIGNETYAKENNSFGLTTLRNRHVQIRGGELKFLFKGKSGKTW